MISPADSLKLNILIKTSIAIRIDRYKLEVIGLNKDFAEKIVKLNPNIDSDKYIKAVQQFLTEKVLGSMGGYPSYLKRWSRMGQVDTANLTSLLKIGSPNAVIAVSNSKNLSEELLNLVWWCATNTDEQAEIGRFLLSKPELINNDVAKQVARKIASHLLEFLPFSENQLDLINTANLILQNDLISDEKKSKLWKTGARKHYILIGFLERQKGNLPEVGNQDEIFLKTCLNILKKINQEYILYRVLELISNHFKTENTTTKISSDELIEKVKNLENKEQAGEILARVGEHLVISEISAHALSGSTIRKKLSYILEPINTALTLSIK
jgi:hypothetical protein